MPGFPKGSRVRTLVPEKDGIPAHQACGEVIRLLDADMKPAKTRATPAYYLILMDDPVDPESAPLLPPSTLELFPANQVSPDPGSLRTATCWQCKNEFHTAARNAKFCSKECATEYWRSEKACPVCGTKFMPHGRQKYCSKECAASKEIGLPVDGKAGAHVRAARMSAGLSMGQLAKRMGVTRQYVSVLELSETPITPNKLRAVSEALGMPIPDILAAEPQADPLPETPVGRLIARARITKGLSSTAFAAALNVDEDTIAVPRSLAIRMAADLPVASLVRASMERERMTPQVFADRIGHAREVIYDWMHGMSTPLEPDWKRIADVLHVDPDEVAAAAAIQQADLLKGPKTRFDAARIRGIMKEKDIAIAELARRIGLSYTKMYRIFDGQRNPTDDIVFAIAAALDTDESNITKDRRNAGDGRKD